MLLQFPRALPRVLLSAAATSRAGRLQFFAAMPQGLPDHLQDMASELSAGEAQLLDVREPAEMANGMLECAEPAPLSALQDGVRPAADEAKRTYLHCAAGIRVHPASAILQSMGYTDVVPLQEGFSSLKELGFELKTR
jgi:rhodanese-related sulfurtransferase